MVNYWTACCTATNIRCLRQVRMPICISIYIPLSMYLSSIYTYTFISFSLYIDISIYLCNYLSLCLSSSIHVSISFLSIYVSTIYMYIYSYIFVYISLPTSLSFKQKSRQHVLSLFINLKYADYFYL